MSKCLFQNLTYRFQHLTPLESSLTVPDNIHTKLQIFLKSLAVYSDNRTELKFLIFFQGYAVHKFENFPKKGSQSVCYVSHLNRTNPATPQQVKDAMTDNEVTFNYS